MATCHTSQNAYEICRGVSVGCLHKNKFYTTHARGQLICAFKIKSGCKIQVLAEEENFYVRRMSFKWFLRGKSLWLAVNGQTPLQDKWQWARRSEKCLQCWTKRTTFVPMAVSHTGWRQHVNKCSIKHVEFMYEKPVMLNDICHAASGAAVFAVSGRTQTCFLGLLWSHLATLSPRTWWRVWPVETFHVSQLLAIVKGTFWVPFWP